MKLFGHEAMSREALAQFVKGLPPNLKFLGPFLTEGTVHHALNRDVLDVFPTFGHWTKAGQRHHFMCADSETERQAYKNGMRWIEKHGKEASHNLHKLFIRNSTRHFDSNFITGPLGYAFHAVQDSFAPMHVVREKKGSDYVIIKIHKYSQQNKDHHDASDNRVSKNTKLPRNQEAIIACRELLRIAVKSGLGKTDQICKQRWQSLWNTYVSVFFKERLSR